MPETILYLATDFFLKGGIQRYSRAQVKAIREIVGERQTTVLSVHSPGERSFEEPFRTDYSGGGTALPHRIKYALTAVRYALIGAYDMVWANHISLLPLAVFLSRVFHIPHVVLNIYGLEMWSGLRWYERAVLRYATKIISDCHFTANYVETEFAILPEQVTVIWDPVDTQKFVPMDSAPWILPRYGVDYNPDNTYLMTLGRISVGSRHKGYDRMLDIMKQIERDDIVYLIVGDGDDRMRLEQRVIDEGLSGRVFFLGSIPEKDLVAVYNAADIFVLVSDRGKGRGEGVPLTPLEAASCGKPIIVGNEDGSAESVIDGENGYVVSPRNRQELYERILTLVEKPAMRKAMGVKARTYIMANFSYATFYKKIQSVIDSIRENPK